MDGLVGLFVFALIVMVVSLAATVWGSYRRRLEEIEKAVSAVKRIERWANPQVVLDLTARVNLLEKALRAGAPPEAKPVAPPPLPPPVPAPAARPEAKVAPPEAKPVPPPVPLPPSVVLPAPVIVAPPPVVVPAPPPEPKPPEAKPIMAPAPPPPRPVIVAPPPETKLAPAPPVAPPPPKPPVAVPPPAPVPVPAFASAGAESEKWQNRLRENVGGRDWEATIGGNWLNKIGAAVLVIGIALFLSYSITRMGPAGRVALALGVSVALLGAGAFLERRAGYVVFARGLLGAGWAALYSTAYAMHALEAARVIENPVAGAVLLLAVSAGMIVHSLHYRSQTVTGLAYFIAFLSLNLTPVTSFAVVALIPLAVSLLYLAQRFSWFRMAVFGIIATYGTAVLKSTGTATLAETQSLLGVFWLVFEGFDLIRVSRRAPATVEALAIFPLNAVGAVSLSLAKWLTAAPGRIHGLYAGAALAYLASAVIRGLLRRPSAFPKDARPADRAISGYYAAITLATAGAVFGVFARLSGVWIVAALAAEAELLFLFGAGLGERYLRALAMGVFGLGAADLAIRELPGERLIPFAGRDWLGWTPAALLMTALYYLNRVLKRPGLVYSWAACAALGVVIGFEAPAGLRGPAWLALAFVLFQVGFWARLPEFRWQSYVVAVASWLVLPTEGAWRWLAVAAAIHYVASAQMVWIRRLSEQEQRWVRYAASWAGTILLAGFIWRWVPLVWLGTGWLILAFVLFQVGFWLRLADFRWQSYTAAAASCIALVAANLLGQGISAAQGGWKWLAAAAAIHYVASAQMVWIRRLSEEEQRWVRCAASWAGTILLAGFIWKWVPLVWLGTGWLLLAFVLLQVGFWLRLADFRWQCYCAAVAGWVALVAVNLLGEGVGAWKWLAAATAIQYVASAQMVRIRRLSEEEQRWVRYGASWAGTFLLAGFVWKWVPLVWLGAGWLIMAFVLFQVGFWLRLPEFRWQGYTAATVSWVTLVAVNLLDQGVSAADLAWRWLALAAAIDYAVAGQMVGLLRAPGDEQRGVRDAASWAGTFFAAAVLWKWLPEAWVGAGWLALAVALFEIGLALGVASFRRQAAAAGALGYGALLWINVIGGNAPWAVLGAATLLSYPLALQLNRFGAKRLGAGERTLTREVASLAGTTFLAALVWYAVPPPLVAVGWALIALLLIESGLPLAWPFLRAQGHTMAAIASGRLFFSNFTTMGSTAGVSHRLLTVAPLIVMLYSVWSRLGDAEARLEPWERRGRRFYLWVPAVLAVVLARFELGRTLVVVGWAALGLVLLYIGARTRNRDLRYQSYGLAALTFFRSWNTNFYAPESFGGVPSRVLTGATVVASFFLAEFIARRPEDYGEGEPSPTLLDRHARKIFSLLASVLLAVLIFYEVSGSLLTVAWGLEGLLVLSLGFPTRERVLRLAGLALFTFCVLKLFAYDLRELDTPDRILSFIVLGLLLLGVSWIYTRFKEHVRRFL